jgi:hypothetical protein
VVKIATFAKPENVMLYKMKTKIRLLTMFFSLVVLVLLVSIPAVTIFEMVEKESLEINEGAGTFFIMLLFSLGSLTAIIKWTKTITINGIQNKIIIRHPFLLQKREYNFDEIVGFRWSYLPARVSYKSIKLKSTDGRVYQFSDFEIGNFRAVEKVVLKSFELKSDKGWIAVSDKQKQFELERSKAFDIEQAENIRWYLWSFIILLSLLSLYYVHQSYKNEFNVRLREMIFLAIMLLSLYGLVVKLKSINQYLKNYEA